MAVEKEGGWREGRHDVLKKSSIEKPIAFFFFILYISERAFCGLLDTWMGVSQGTSHRYQSPQTLQNICVVMSHETIEPDA